VISLFSVANSRRAGMTIDELNRFRQTVAELGLDEGEVLDKVERAARADMIDRGWEGQYRYWGLGGVTQGDATDEDIRADAERHGLPYDPEKTINVLEAYQTELESLIWEKLDNLRAEKDRERA
jgi:hypothetical protein